MDYDYLIRSGIPSGLVVKLMDWEERCPRVTGVGRNSDLGSSLNDMEFVAAWKHARSETHALVEGCSWYVDVVCDTATKVFDARPTDEWTDGEIVGWRRRLLRLQRISEYGGLHGEHFRDMGGNCPADLHTLPIPCPEGLVAADERDAFLTGFMMRAYIDPWRGLDYSRWRLETTELERELELRPTKKPPGGEVPPGGR